MLKRKARKTAKRRSAKRCKTKACRGGRKMKKRAKVRRRRVAA